MEVITGSVRVHALTCLFRYVNSAIMLIHFYLMFDSGFKLSLHISGFASSTRLVPRSPHRSLRLRPVNPGHGQLDDNDDTTATATTTTNNNDDDNNDNIDNNDINNTNVNNTNDANSSANHTNTATEAMDNFQWSVDRAPHVSPAVIQRGCAGGTCEDTWIYLLYIYIYIYIYIYRGGPTPQNH